MKVRILLCVLLCYSPYTFAQKLTWLNTQALNTSIRAIFAIDQQLYIGGSNGYFGWTDPQGNNIHWKQIKGFEKFDFRGIYASKKEGVFLVNAGSPAFIIHSKDAFQNIDTLYQNSDPQIFLDAIHFMDAKNGLIFGDPIQGKMQLLATKDGGFTWKNRSNTAQINLKPMEAGFAASNSSMTSVSNKIIWIATGGATARVWKSINKGKTWKAYHCPIVQGKNSTGIFSIAFYDAKNGVVVGGDYLNPNAHEQIAYYSNDGGENWKKAKTQPNGYRSSVIYIDKNTLLCTGTNGTDLSNDGGENWHSISEKGFNALFKSENGRRIYLAGANGSIALFEVNPS